MSHIVRLDNNKRIYLDYAATTPIDADVLEVMLPYFDGRYGNPSSMHTSGRDAKKVITEARMEIASVIGAQPGEIIFTGSGTESDNFAVLGATRAHKDAGRHVLVSPIEHKAVLEPAHQLEREGFEVEYIPVDATGMVDVKECLSLVRDDTTLISLMYANNEIGTVEPIAELARALHERRGSGPLPILHTDACQAAGYLDINVTRLGVDLMTLNSSKVYGPKGVGLLYVRGDTKITPLITGGEQERNMRAGTENIALIRGFTGALKKAQNMRQEESARLEKLRSYFISELKKRIPLVVVNGHPKHHLPNNVHISISNIEGEATLLLLDQKGIEASTGSACSAFDLRPSHVLLAIGQDENLVHGSIRFSLGRSTTKEDLDYVLEVFPEIVEKLSSISVMTSNKYAKQKNSM